MKQKEWNNYFLAFANYTFSGVDIVFAINNHMDMRELWIFLAVFSAYAGYVCHKRAEQMKDE